MTFPDPDDAVATTTGRAGQHGGRVPRGADAIYLLVFGDPEEPAADRRAGWSLLARLGNDRCWSIDLTTCGATVHTSTEEAMAIAERVLDMHGVATTGWRRGTAGRTPRYRPSPTTGDSTTGDSTTGDSTIPAARDGRREVTASPGVPAPSSPLLRFPRSAAGPRS